MLVVYVQNLPHRRYCDITGSKLLCKPIEVYRFRRNGLSADDSVYFVQQRAPCLRGQSKKFCGDLADLLYGSAVGCALLVVASGASTASMLDEAVQGYVLLLCVHFDSFVSVITLKLVGVNSNVAPEYSQCPLIATSVWHPLQLLIT